MATFTIGQAVWLAQFESTEKHVTCADCGGTKHLRVILFDGTEHTIECEGCTRGWRGPVGYNTVLHREAVAVPARITGVELDSDGITYKTDRQWYVAEANVCATEAEALTRAAEKAEAENAADLARLAAKEKPTKSWSWHVHYHRRECREAEKRLAYHKGKLEMAKAQAKDARRAIAEEA